MPKPDHENRWISIEQAVEEYNATEEQLKGEVLGGDLETEGVPEGRSDVRVLRSAVEKKYGRRSSDKSPLSNKIGLAVALTALLLLIWGFFFPTPSERRQMELDAAIRYVDDRVATIREDLRDCDELSDADRAAVDGLLIRTTDRLRTTTSLEEAVEMGDELHAPVLREKYPPGDCWSAFDPRAFGPDDLQLIDQVFDPSDLTG